MCLNLYSEKMRKNDINRDILAIYGVANGIADYSIRSVRLVYVGPYNMLVLYEVDNKYSKLCNLCCFPLNFMRFR